MLSYEVWRKRRMKLLLFILHFWLERSRRKTNNNNGNKYNTEIRDKTAKAT